MLDEFLELRVVNRSRGLVKSDCRISYEPEGEGSPSHSEEGTPIIYIAEPRDDERHVAIGKFMDAWSKLEVSIATTLCDVMGIQRTFADGLMNTLGTRGQMDMMSLFGTIALPAQHKSTLTALLERLKTQNTRRNYIVHGHWVLEAWLGNANGKLTIRLRQYRSYDPSDPAVQVALRNPESRKERTKFLFSIDRINSITAELARLKADFKAFYCLRHGLPPDSQVLRVTAAPPRP